MRYILAAALVVALAAPAAAGYRVQLKGPAEATLRGRAGLHAVDSRTASTLVRVIAPGNEIGRRGTLRVLVMNLGTRPFTFGPGDVSLRLADGTELAFMPAETFDEAASMVRREAARDAAVRSRVNANLNGVGQSAATGNNGQTLSANSATPGAGMRPGAASELDVPDDPNRRAIDEILGAVDGVMRPMKVAPQEAGGGYLVFELPREVRSAKADRAATLVVRAAGDEHRFEALLERR